MSDEVKLRGAGGREWVFDLPLRPAFADQLARGELTVVDDDSADPEPPAPLTVAELKERAAELGLEVPKKAKRDDLVALVEAEEERLADEAAAAQASSSGEGDQGGNQPGNDPDASGSGESGTPPAS